LVYGKTVPLAVKDIDHHGRTAGIVYDPDGQNVNAALVGAGLAWWYETYAPNDGELQRAEEWARNSKTGLWAVPNPVAPRDWRRANRPAR